MEEVFEEKYEEMYIDEMKKTKSGIQNAMIDFKTKKNFVLCIPETKENRWDLVALCEHYDECIAVLQRVKKKYSKMINIAENDELEEDDFKDRIKEIQRIHGEVAKACKNKKIIAIEEKYLSAKNGVINL